MKSVVRNTVLLLNSFLLVGCVDWVEDKQDLVAFVDEAKKIPGGRVEPLPEFKPYHSFVYEGASMREPFEPLIPIVPIDEDKLAGDGGKNDLQPDEAREKSYLETFAIDDLAMVGTITGLDDGQLWALIKDSNAELHRVKVGDHLGLDFGEIVQLNEQEIQMVEIVTNGRGGWMKRPRSMTVVEAPGLE